MNLARVLPFAAAAAALGLPALAQAPTDEPALRDTIARYAQAWNRHDVDAWKAFLAPEVDLRHYDWGDTGIDAAVQAKAYSVQTMAVRLDVVALKVAADGRATVRLRQDLCAEPQPDGSCKVRFQDDPVVAVWRRDGDRWLLVRFKSFKPQAEADLRAAGLLE